ncbi:MAG TPA: biotin--[acetyl-CoA-carboxylase] ligase [Candidatus Limnocylindria bacterium]
MLQSNELFADAARRGRRIGHTVEVHASIGSTNDRARELLASPTGEGTAVVAEEQRLGRGRRGRTWISPPGRNLTMSVGIRPRLAATDAWQLGLAAALAARGACAEVAPVWLKWPNDVIADDGRKLGGLLVETAINDASLTEAVVGIGLNVNWATAEMPDEIAATATSLASLSGSEVDRAALLGRLLGELDEEVRRIESGQSPLTRYREACRTVGAPVVVDLGTHQVRGLATGIDDHGGLQVETAGGLVTVATGEVVHARAAAGA